MKLTVPEGNPSLTVQDVSIGDYFTLHSRKGRSSSPVFRLICSGEDGCQCIRFDETLMGPLYELLDGRLLVDRLWKTEDVECEFILRLKKEERKEPALPINIGDVVSVPWDGGVRTGKVVNIGNVPLYQDHLMIENLLHWFPLDVCRKEVRREDDYVGESSK